VEYVPAQFADFGLCTIEKPAFLLGTNGVERQARGWPRCQGVSYPAWDLEQFVSGLFNAPGMWHDLLGPDAQDDLATRVAETWRVLPEPWQRDWLKNAVTRIELSERKGKMSITFAPDVAKPLLDLIAKADDEKG